MKTVAVEGLDSMETQAKVASNQSWVGVLPKSDSGFPQTPSLSLDLTQNGTK